jgi:putative endonuclease
MIEKVYYTYILTNYHNSVLYIGITNNLIKRIYEHKNKLVKGFTSKYNLNKLVYYELLETPTEAIKREKQLKNLVRRKKENLICRFNPKWEDLYNKILK